MKAKRLIDEFSLKYEVKDSSGSRLQLMISTLVLRSVSH